MAVRSHRQGIRPGIAFFHHDLVPDAPFSGIEVDPVLLSECLNLPIFFEVGLADVLNIVVKGHNKLLRAVNLSGSHRHVAKYDWS